MREALLTEMRVTTRRPPRPARLARAGVPLLVLTTSPRVATQSALLHGTVPAVLAGGLEGDSLMSTVRARGAVGELLTLACRTARMIRAA